MADGPGFSFDDASTMLLLLLGIVMFNNFRNGTLGDWFRAKFLNSAAPRKSSSDGPMELEPGPFPGDPGAGQPPASSNPVRPASTTTPAPAGSHPMFLWPVSGNVISGFGASRDGGARKHEGIDIGAPMGTPVKASAPGTVKQISSTGNCGNRVDVAHADGWLTRYCHMRDRPLVKIGQQVSAGAQLGVVGMTGNAVGTTPHLHFETRHNGTAVDPRTVLTAATAGAPVGVA